MFWATIAELSSWGAIAYKPKYLPSGPLRKSLRIPLLKENIGANLGNNFSNRHEK